MRITAGYAARHLLSIRLRKCAATDSTQLPAAVVVSSQRREQKNVLLYHRRPLERTRYPDQFYSVLDSKEN
jgi:hypothetical protein